MRKLVLIVALLVLAVSAFAQQSYVSKDYTGYNTPRLTQDPKLGFHDVMASPTGDNAQNAAQRNGCQSCHVPHGGAVIDNYTVSGTATTGPMYLWKYNVPTNIAGNDGNGNIALDAASFHTLGCLSCHDGATATDVVANNTLPSYVKVASDASGLMNDHPVNQILGLHGTVAPTLKYVRLYTPSGTSGWASKGSTTPGSQYGYVECGSCHDPHMGDANTYDYLRGPANGVTYTQTDSLGNTTTYTGTSPQWARLGLCRDCHGK